MADTGDPAISATVTINSSTSSAGFIHPGIGVSADGLENTRAELLAGVSPWTAFYHAMVVTPYASTTLTSANQGNGDGVPANNAFNNVGVCDMLYTDSVGAYTQAVMYYLTGNPVYRENAMKIIRIWSHMDPTQYHFFTDAEIKTGPYVYRLIAAAELLRYTSAIPAADGYQTTWTDQDTSDFTENFIVPAVQTFDYGNAWYMNQGTLPLLGALAGYIFTNNRDRYNQGVEWFSMNSTAPNQNVNGALGSMFRLIDKNNPQNTTGSSFVNHLEMGRDQAHAGDDVLTLTTLARIVATQKTMLDPVNGTVSIAPNAVDPYQFLNDRLLMGANQFTAFMMGYNIPWIDITGQGGKLAQSYRGRWSSSLNELYYIYQYQEHVNVAQVAPAIAQQFEQRDGPLYYNFNVNEVGTQIGSDGLQSFWGGTLTGDDYWLSIPSAAAGEAVPAPQKNLPFVQKGSVISGNVTTQTQNSLSYLHADLSTEPAVIAVRTMQYGSQTGYSPVSIRVRTTATATLNVQRLLGTTPYTTITVPNTNGQWRTITYDMDKSVVSLAQMGDNNIVYYTFTGTGSIDLDQVDANAAGTVTPPIFPQGYSTTLIGVAGEPLSSPLTATDSSPSDTVTYSAQGLPSQATLDPTTGAFDWTPTSGDVGDRVVVVQADNGTSETALSVRIRIAATRAEALQLAQDGYSSATPYTDASTTAFSTAVTTAQAAVANDTDFLSAINAVLQATANLQPLSPLLPDGTLDYHAIVTSSLGADALGYLVDNDNYTYSGDLSVNYFTLDFGPNYRVTANAFGIQARQTFGNRSQGSNVYGSNDGVTWTKLTTQMTTDTNAMETLPVDPQFANTPFRFIKVQDDVPGVPSDPNFPGIFSVAEFRIHGVRSEVVNEVASATISSNDPVPGIATNGDAVTVAFTTTAPVTAVKGTIEGVPATMSGSGTSWRAQATLPNTIPSGTDATFQIGYTTADGTVAAPLMVTTDGSQLFLSNSSGLVQNVPEITTPVSPTGAIESSKAPYIANMFDNNASTFSDIGPVGGQFYAILDFGQGGSLALNHAELLVRQDSWGTSRAGNLHLEGSNDLKNWTVLTNNAQPTLNWQTWGLRPGLTPTPFRYLKIANTDWINIAELRLFGAQTAAYPNSITTAHIASNGPVSSRAVAGNTVSVSFTASEDITHVAGTINGTPATITGSGTNWQASVTLGSTVQPGNLVPFDITYAGPNGQIRQDLVRTTDASTVFLSTNDNLVENVPSISTPVSPTGAPESDKAPYIAKMFDNDASTFSDIGPVGGQFYAILDFGAKNSITLDHAELLVRQDNWGTSRAGNLHLEGSNDLKNWTVLTGNAQPTLNWQTWSLLPGLTPTAYRYLKIANTDWINIAELRLFTPAPNSSGGAPTVVVPGAPTNVTASATDSQVSLSWSAPTSTGGATITSYVVEMSTNSGAFAAVPSEDLSFFGPTAMVTGLTDGIDYQFRVAAVNNAGPGSWSSTVSATPVGPSSSPTPAPTGTPTAPAPSDSTLPANTPTVSASGNSADNPTRPGTTITMTGSGFSPSEKVAVWIYSSPQYVGQLQADVNGNIAGQVTLPVTLATGQHTLVSVGMSSDRIFSVPFFVANSTPTTSSEPVRAVGPSVNTGGVVTTVPTTASLLLWWSALVLLLSSVSVVVVVLRRKMQRGRRTRHPDGAQ